MAVVFLYLLQKSYKEGYRSLFDCQTSWPILFPALSALNLSYCKCQRYFCFYASHSGKNESQMSRNSFVIWAKHNLAKCHLSCIYTNVFTLGFCSKMDQFIFYNTKNFIVRYGLARSTLWKQLLPRSKQFLVAASIFVYIMADLK